jgi:hypothetical protein
VGFVVDKAEMGLVSSEYFRLPCHSFHPLLLTHHHPPSRAVTIGQIVGDVLSGLHPTVGFH